MFQKDYPLQRQMIINVFTEYRRNGTKYCAHPSYNSFGEWYDWAMVKFEIDDETSDLSDEEQCVLEGVAHISCTPWY